MEIASDIDRRIAARLGELRTARGWTLAQLEQECGVSRSTLSRMERGELSPAAAVLSRLCAVYGMTLSRLIAEAERSGADLVAAADQVTWTDPATGYVRRAVSPPGAGLRGELVEVRLGAGTEVNYDRSPVAGLEHHLWLLEGGLELEVEGKLFRLRPGDCVRYVLTGATRFRAAGKRGARYAIAIVHP